MPGFIPPALSQCASSLPHRAACWQRLRHQCGYAKKGNNFRFGLGQRGNKLAFRNTVLHGGGPGYICICTSFVWALRNVKKPGTQSLSHYDSRCDGLGADGCTQREVLHLVFQSKGAWRQLDINKLPSESCDRLKRQTSHTVSLQPRKQAITPLVCAILCHCPNPDRADVYHHRPYAGNRIRYSGESL